MRRQWQSFRMALRALAWRSTAEPPAAGLPALVAWALVALAGVAAAESLSGGPFTEFGLGLTVGALALWLLAGALLLRPSQRVAALTPMLIAALLIAAITGGALMLASLTWPANVRWWTRGDMWLMLAVATIWLIGAYRAVIRSFAGAWARNGWRAAAIVAAQALALAAFPHAPVFVTQAAYDSPPNTWQLAREWLAPKEPGGERVRRVDGARVELAQPELIEQAVARLAPQQRGATDVYAIGIAGFAEQDVFIKELDGALAAIGKVLPLESRTLRLVNHADSVEHTPVASRANFAAAVRAIARTMDRDEDILLLFITSHGAPQGVALTLPGLISADLAPRDVARVLDREGIRNRIVIVSACYAGVFVAPLANDDTIVLTAADANNSSFGCSHEREWTWFGEALFRISLPASASLAAAFNEARRIIGEWEARDALTPSNPQGHFGAALTAKLASIYRPAPAAEHARAAQPQ